MPAHLRPSVLLAALAAAAANAADAPAPVDERALQLPRIVLGIVAYARWPQPLPGYRLCIAGEAAELDALLNVPAAVGERPLEARRIDLDDDGAIPPACDIIYLGRGTAPQARRSLYAAAAGQPVLTISTVDGECAEGSQFCLRVPPVPGTPTLLLNLDAISRGAVRVNPRVLQITRSLEDGR
ncbi:YfiR family protein [Pseudothauera lacus]|uniref:DUF4154 domain-containing protein n=1 Tax=Pseudothauera lacus TaxID=2136175 RepID=A0A2T4IEF0_9RHOO|nr:YfiR family protein [Pseudothauera lacus]PTD96149.1 DUF4154 domain-containing protein [Pseudothauera lacus]